MVLPEKKINIMLVDDNENNLIALSSAIDNPDYNLILAHSGTEALGKLLKSPVAVILLDVMMPDMDGYQVASMIKERQKTQAIPILFVTAIANEPAQVAQGYSVGAVDYLQKPLDPTILKYKVAVFVNLYKNQLEIQSKLEVIRLEEILAYFAHDLKNPLTAILLNAQLLQKIPILAKKATLIRHQTETILVAAQRMERMIQDLLDATKLGFGSFVIQPAEHLVEDFIQETMSLLIPLATQKKITLSLEVDLQFPTVFCDRVQVLRVLANLLSNSIKFTPEGGKVVLGVKPSGEEVEFFVLDSGPGLNGEEQSHAFDRFWQKSSETKKGTGLGLYISKCIVEGHGSKIGIDSIPNHGAKFFFTLPRKQFIPLLKSA